MKQNRREVEDELFERLDSISDKMSTLKGIPCSDVYYVGDQVHVNVVNVRHSALDKL